MIGKMKKDIYLIFSVEELSNILDAGVRSVIRYKKILIEYELIYEKRLGQGKPNWIYVLKPELNKNQKCQKATLMILTLITLIYHR